MQSPPASDTIHPLQPYLRPVYGLCLRLLGDSTAAEDAAQETFLQAIQIWDRFTPPATPPSGGRDPRLQWLLAIAARRALALRRSRERLVPLPENPMTLAPDLPPTDSAERAETFARIDAALQTLPAEERQAILLHHVSGLSQAEVAEALSLPPRTVSHRIADGLTALRNNLERKQPATGSISGRFANLALLLTQLPDPAAPAHFAARVFSHPDILTWTAAHTATAATACTATAGASSTTAGSVSTTTTSTTVKGASLMSSKLLLIAPAIVCAAAMFAWNAGINPSGATAASAPAAPATAQVTPAAQPAPTAHPAPAAKTAPALPGGGEQPQAGDEGEGGRNPQVNPRPNPRPRREGGEGAEYARAGGAPGATVNGPQGGAPGGAIGGRGEGWGRPGAESLKGGGVDFAIAGVNTLVSKAIGNWLQNPGILPADGFPVLSGFRANPALAALTKTDAATAAKLAEINKADAEKTKAIGVDAAKKLGAAFDTREKALRDLLSADDQKFFDALTGAEAAMTAAVADIKETDPVKHLAAVRDARQAALKTFNAKVNAGLQARLQAVLANHGSGFTGSMDEDTQLYEYFGLVRLTWSELFPAFDAQANNAKIGAILDAYRKARAEVRTDLVKAVNAQHSATRKALIAALPEGQDRKDLETVDAWLQEHGAELSEATTAVSMGANDKLTELTSGRTGETAMAAMQEYQTWVQQQFAASKKLYDAYAAAWPEGLKAKAAKQYATGAGQWQGGELPGRGEGFAKGVNGGERAPGASPQGNPGGNPADQF